MPDLFDLTQLASYMQSDLDLASATLARDLATSLIRSEVGASRYDALTDLSAFLPVALDVARRIMLNPDMRRSSTRQIDDYTETNTYLTESAGGVELTESERARVLAAAGVASAGAFTIRPAGTSPGYCLTPRWH